MNKITSITVAFTAFSSTFALLSSVLILDKVKENSALKEDLEVVVQELKQTKQQVLTLENETVSGDELQDLKDDVNNINSVLLITDNEANLTENTNEKTIHSQANLRREASLYADIVKVFTPGEKVTVKSYDYVEKNGYTWVQVVDENDVEGWVASEFMQ